MHDGFNTYKCETIVIEDARIVIKNGDNGKWQ